MKIFFTFFLTLITFSQSKINGLSFVASNKISDTEEIRYVKNVNANWVTLMPFAFMRTEKDTVLIFNSKSQWVGERVEGIEKITKQFKQEKISVMIKPQIWIPRGGFTGNINFRTEKEWQAFEKNYEKFIITYVEIAVKTNTDMFCIGTELKYFAQKRVAFFQRLISRIRSQYKGKITYAENWDCFEDVTFWNLLDYIGIDAYFELLNNKTPKVSSLIQSWKPIKAKIKLLSDKFSKKILFTEYGYQSKDFSTNKPYLHSEVASVNLQTQSNALEALFKCFWNEDWFAGGFNWKWYDDYKNNGGSKDTDYTIQNKPAEKILKKYYKK